jgi:hypothetical protein
MRPVAHFWLIAAKSHFAAPSAWMLWADKVISTTDRPALWLADMSVADSLAKLEIALKDRLATESSKTDPEHHNALLGYLFMRYKAGTLTLEELLQQAGEESDSGPITVECEKFYSLLYRLEKATSVLERQRLSDMVENTFKPFQLMAAEQWKLLTSTERALDLG